eukprot:6057809-Alexandrium_andersonii.AAC.1
MSRATIQRASCKVVVMVLEDAVQGATVVCLMWSTSYEQRFATAWGSEGSRYDTRGSEKPEDAPHGA